MSSNLPAILGGTPVRSSGFRTTPEVGPLEAEFVSRQVLSGAWQAWQPNVSELVERVLCDLPLPANVLDSLGVETAALAAELAQLQAPGLGVHVIPMNNGTHAIEIAMAAIAKWADELGLRGFEVGSEVLVTALTWQASAAALLARGLVPVLVDVLPGTLCMDPEAMAAAITDRTVGVIPVHLYDRMAEMKRISEILDPLGIAKFEDAAHAMGAVYLGKGAGTHGHAGSSSHQGSKNLSCGEGGSIYTMDPRLADQICSLVTCGRRVGGSKVLQANNDRIPMVAAALLRAQIRRFPEQNALRTQTFTDFDALVRAELGELGLGVNEDQPNVDVQPTYKKVVRVDLTEWSGMTLRQWLRAMQVELTCEFAPIYEPLTDSPFYTPLSDPARFIGADVVERLDPKIYKAIVAEEAFGNTAVMEHAAGLDGRIPELFAEAAHKIHPYARQISRVKLPS